MYYFFHCRNKDLFEQTGNLGIISLQTVNQLTMINEITQPVPSPGNSTSLLGKQIRMSDLYTVHRLFSITPENKFQDK